MELCGAGRYAEGLRFALGVEQRGAVCLEGFDLPRLDRGAGDRREDLGEEQATLSFRTPGDVALTPAQRACAWFFLVMASLFLVQTLVEATSQHYRTDLTSFFGLDLARWLPYNLMRTWHVQLAIFWVATPFLAAGIFLAPMIAGREPRGQRHLAYSLLGALAIVVFGSLIGEWIGIFGLTGDLWAWFGNQGFEYIDLGRFW